MTVHAKTVEFAFPSYPTNVVAANRYDFGAITLYLPEVTSRAFLSVALRITYCDNVAVAATMTLPVVGIKLGGVAFDDVTLGNPSANSGENQSWLYERDVTAYFNANFGAGATQTCQVGVQVTGLDIINIGAKLIITYEAEDQAIRVKTVRIPIESPAGPLTNSLVELGTNQIPALDTFLPEASKTYRNVWIEAYYNTHNTAATNDCRLGISVGGGGEQLTGPHESANTTAVYNVYYFDQGAPAWATNAAQSIAARSDLAGMLFNTVAFVLHVTYEYDHDASSTILNSILAGLGPFQMVPGLSAATANYSERELYIEEPGTPTLVQSGALMFDARIAATTLNYKFGGQAAFRTYTPVTALFAGQATTLTRIDAGGSGGAALTLARGRNVLAIRAFVGSTTTVTPAGLSGYYIINYTSEKHPDGEGVHNHTLYRHLINTQLSAGQVSPVTSVAVLDTPETDYFLNSVILRLTGNLATVSGGVVLRAYAVAPEEGAPNPLIVGSSSFTTDAENGIFCTFFSIDTQRPHRMQRWSGDPDTSRLALTVSRVWWIAGPTGAYSLAAYVTVHSITFPLTGDVRVSGGGAVTLKAYRVINSNDEHVLSTSRVGSGAYAMTWFDDTIPVAVRAFEDATHYGASEEVAIP